MKLSDNRAGAVKQWLVSNAGVQASRIETAGWGEQGRQKNRRVGLTLQTKQRSGRR